jgi:2-polyprenyl-6-hydroxyphenyl methylase/3-demethylubiquinone-9 3-methyltransferase
MTTPPASSINPSEANFFGNLADDWWNPRGTSAMLHRITPVRSSFIRDSAAQHFELELRSRQPLAGLKALDIGCGAGLQAEPLARMGAAVTAIDAAPENIEAAKAHAKAQALDIDYRCVALEDLAETNKTFDIITCLEVIEHVANRDAFLAALSQLLAPGGLAIFSTPNRTPASWAVVIAGAEIITRSIPRGAHDWNQFLTPAELSEALVHAGLHVESTHGLTWRPAQGFVMGNDTSVNYFIVAAKEAAKGG